MKTLTLTIAELNALAQALSWVDAAGDHCELFEHQPKRAYALFLQVKARVDALR